MSVIAAPADRRFHRAHVKPARRRHWRGVTLVAAKYAVIVVAVGVAAYRGVAWATHSRHLQIDRIAVRGNARLSTGEVLAVMNGLKGQSVLWTDLESWRRRLLASPWVRDAALRRSLPSTIEVAVSERQPIAICRMNGGLYLIDERGVVIDEYGPQYADVDLPIVDGLSLQVGDGEARADEPRAVLAARLVAALKAKPEISARVSQIDVSDLHNAAVMLSGDPAKLYLGEDRFDQRLESYLELSPALRQRVQAIEYVDLRFDGRIYVRPVEKSNAKSNGKIIAKTDGKTTGAKK